MAILNAWVEIFKRIHIRNLFDPMPSHTSFFIFEKETGVFWMRNYEITAL
jgi:hypothetical protein